MVENWHWNNAQLREWTALMKTETEYSCGKVITRTWSYIREEKN